MYPPNYMIASGIQQKVNSRMHTYIAEIKCCVAWNGSRSSDEHLRSNFRLCAPDIRLSYKTSIRFHSSLRSVTIRDSSSMMGFGHLQLGVWKDPEKSKNSLRKIPY